MLLKLDCLKLKRSTVARVPASEILVSLGDWNGHVGADDDGFDEVHGGQGFGVRNAEGVTILEFALANDLRVGNTWFKKRDSYLITYSSGDYKTQIDYILFHNFDTNHMASLTSTVEIGGAGSRHRQTASSVSGLADSRGTAQDWLELG